MEGPQYQPGQELPGTVYRIVRHLATGGMGSVYDVEDVTVGKRYVLKTLHPQLVGREDLARRMKEEARTLGRLQHPNIVDVVTAGVTREARATPYYVMERLNGNNLRVLLEKRGSLELQHCYEIAIDVADALEHAHENGVIHRDVKPENIFLHRNSNGTTTTKLLDFGIMRLLDRKQSHTQGKFIGTLRYASPEQIMGGELGPATDIYSLGVVLYETLCGRGPFDGVGDAYAIGAAHAQMMPPPLSRFARVPPALEQLVMSTLGKTPAERPRDCFTLAAELRKLRREEENAPRSVTAIAVLSSVPDTRASSVGELAGTEPAVSTGQTQQGMIPPSAIGSTLSPAHDDVAFARTVASEPKAPPIAAGIGIDRNAATRASGAEGHTQRLAQHGTLMEMEERMAAADEAVRAALAEQQPLVVPPVHGGPPPSGDMVFPRRANAISTVTGPLAGEARTRPPESGVLLPIVAIVALCCAIAGGAVLLVKKPWMKRDAATAPTTATGPIVAPPIVQPATATAPTPATSPSRSTSPATAASPSPSLSSSPSSPSPPTAAVETAKTAPSTTASASAATARPAGHASHKPAAAPPNDAPAPSQIGF